MATAEPWTGTESLHDSALRMLDDSHKKLRSPSSSPSIPQRKIVNLRPDPKRIVSAADRLANARDKTSIYAISQQGDMSKQERERWRKELKERFTPGARPMPTSIQGLTSLANERIEDAIARGQFKNIPRGKGANVERDYNASSPFLDTTEYFMNKIIQKQEIVPPWIEKQQELVKSLAVFRNRLRNDWRRHAARTISSAGGSVQDQVRRARAYALAEEKVNPGSRTTAGGGNVERFSSISSDGTLMTVTVEERIAAGLPEEAPSGNDGAASVSTQQNHAAEVVEIKVTEEPAEKNGVSNAADDVAATQPGQPPSHEETTAQEPPLSSSPGAAGKPDPKSDVVLPAPYPFRDPDWEKAELAYHTLAVQELNALTRSYNLMAPKIAQKPYLTLARELRRCFADVAPTLPDTILERSRKPTVKVSVLPHREGGVLERFGQGVGAERYRGHEGRIRDEIAGKGYGFREFWRDLFGGNGKPKPEKRQPTDREPTAV